MARHFLRLKLALLRGGLAKSGMQGTVAFVFAYLLAVVTGLFFGGMALFFRAADVDEMVPWLPVAFAVLFTCWVLFPVIGMGTEGTLDVDRLALFPLGPRRLMPGLLLTSAIGFGGVITLLTLVGTTIGLMPVSPAAVLTAAACALLFAMCVASSRLVVTLLSMAARTRRWRDVALTAGPLLAVALQGIRFVEFEEAPTVPQAVRVVTALLPSGPPASAAAAARQGRPLLALAFLVVGVAYLVVVLHLWWDVLQRVLTTAEGRSTQAAKRRGALFRGLAALFPRTRVGAVAAKELRVGWREPRQRAARLALVFPMLASLVVVSGPSTVVLACAVPVWFLAAAATNQFGFDGARHWANVAAGDDVRSDLLGKNLAVATQAVVVVVVFGALSAALTDGWGRLPVAAGLAVAVVGLSLGLGNVASVVAPVPLPDADSNIWSRGNMGQGMAALGPNLATLAVSALVLGPLATAAVLLDHPAWTVSLTVLTVAVGGGTWQWGLRSAVRRSQDRQPELLEALAGA
ncbi:MAG TPA: hypothetical protein VM938_13870 [Acidimicrobiales bacterium]|nr:hypothetical protein [Acidimicrobiales bacterium]